MHAMVNPVSWENWNFPPKDKIWTPISSEKMEENISICRLLTILPNTQSVNMHLSYVSHAYFQNSNLKIGLA